jgi:hypothetical protein
MRICAQHIGAPVEEYQFRKAAEIVEHGMKVLVRQPGAAVHNDNSIITIALGFVG